MWILLLVTALIYLFIKMILWKLYFQAVLLYFSECGSEPPTAEIIKKYAEKVIIKKIGIKE